jgi:hypothetical protein
MKVPPCLGSRARCLATYSEAPFNALPLPLTDGISYVLCRASTNRALTQLPSSYQVVLRKQESFLAEDDRVIAEDSTSWNLQCGMDLYHRGSRLQLGPLAESVDSRDIDAGRSVSAELEQGLLGRQRISFAFSGMNRVVSVLFAI